MMRHYVSLELDDDDKIDGTLEGPKPVVPDYPWGLRISLTEAEMRKLGLDDDPAVGDMLHFAAFAEVKHYSVNDSGDGAQRRVELQITMMSCIEDESTEFEDEDEG